MSYKPINDFAVKDTLGPNDPEKIIYGSDLQDEFDAIASNLGEVGDELTEIGEVVEEAPSDNVVYGRKNDNWVSIALESGGVEEAPLDGKQYAREDAAWTEVTTAAVAWDDVTGKPVEFAPSAHSHAISDVTGLQGALNNVDATSVKSGTFTETVRGPNYNGGTATLEINLANNFTMNFSGAASYTLGLSGAPSGAGDAYGCTLTLDTASMAALVWDASIKWSTGTAPVLAADSAYVFTFLTTDNGTTFKGFVGGQAFA